ncbi:MAG: glycoside hydrolase family 97 catalytic domain-containing protein [Alistipes sp.]|nr:glycoside hydrolase family 97 catalytic domain-containing protein [Alistipes sp.]
MRRLFAIFTLLLLTVGTAFGKKTSVEVSHTTLYNKKYNYTHTITLDWGDGTLRWSSSLNNKEVVAPSRLTMVTDRGTWGENIDRASIKHTDIIEYEAHEHHGAVVNFGDYSVEIRATFDGVAYRFISNIDGDYKIVDELAEFSFNKDDMAWIPYVNFRPDATSDYATQFETSFENIYTHTALKDIDWRRLIFAPVVVEHKGIKTWISESNLEDYPGMFLSNRDGNGTLDTEFAPRPKEVEQGGHNMLQGMVKSRHDYIAECYGKRTFPWRIVAMGKEDRDLANNNLVWELADECRLEDTSWIKPGKVAWEWWNDWGLEGVDFKPGINNDTYKYYIDFASRYGIEYVILDEGWSVNLSADHMKVVPEINIKELVDYAAERNVGIILWAGYWALNRDIEGLCKHYSELGVKGLKVDFLDRDDQEMVGFVYDLAEIAAKYHLLVDYHGVYKPTGLNKTYPNAINFEGVHGLETMKWLGAEHDQITYDVTLPFIRGVAGPMDYTQGAMRNAAKGYYYPDYSRPMSQGTRCHQLAMYIVYNAPLTMLCDSPSNYEKEPEFTEFLASIPTTWMHWGCYSGQIGEYIVTYSRADYKTQYIAGLNGNTPRTYEVECPVIIDHIIDKVEIFIDGPNAATDGSDYQHIVLTQDEYYEQYGRNPIKIDMAAGGGFLIKFTGHSVFEDLQKFLETDEN